MANLNSESYHSLIGFLTPEYLGFLKLQVVPRFTGTGMCISLIPVNRNRGILASLMSGQWSVFIIIYMVIRSNNKLLSSMFRPDSRKILPPRIQRLSWRLQQYKYEIKHVAGRNNIADSISRLPAGDSETSCLSEFCDEYVCFVMDTNDADLGVISLSDIRRETKKDSVLSKLCECVKSGNWSAYAKDKQVMFLRNEMSVHEDILLRGNRIVVPLLLQNDILKLAHETHMGIVKTKQLLRQKFYWVGMDKDIEQLVKNCDVCIINQP